MKDEKREQNQPPRPDLKALAECSECTCFNLRKATRAVTQLFDEAMKPAGLRVTQFSLLAHLSAMGPIALTKLAEAMVTDRTTMARNLEPLEKSGLLEVEAGDDRRTRIVTITEEGRRRLSEALPLWKKAQDEVKKVMGLEGWTSMISNISDLVNRIQAR